MADEKSWFILINGQVAGPFSVVEIESRLTSIDEAQIWGRGQSEWLNPTRWRQALATNSNNTPASLSADPKWQIRIKGIEKRPLKYDELLSYLKSLSEYSDVEIFSEKHGAAWREVYFYTQIVEDLGITRRSHNRVPLVGTLHCKGDGKEFHFRVFSISEGGIGVNDAKDLTIGERFKTTLTSSNLFVTISSDCEVVYVGQDGYAGFRFIGLPPEFHGAIVEYVNKFKA